jgi:hypothetical protein
MNLWRLTEVECSILIYRWKEDNIFQCIWDKSEVMLGTLCFDPLSTPTKQITKKKLSMKSPLPTPNSTWEKKPPSPPRTSLHDTTSHYLCTFSSSTSRSQTIILFLKLISTLFYFIFEFLTKFYWIKKTCNTDFDLRISPARGIALTTDIPWAFEKKSLVFRFIAYTKSKRE